jgi:mono/diheme cytochrome c family protein
MERKLPIALLWSLLVLLVACGEAATATPVPVPISTRIPASTVVPITAPPDVLTPEPVSPGELLFVSKGCSTCHGTQGEGTDIAPPLGGHTGEQVKRQVRSPVGLMPAFPPDKISDQELEQVAQYLTTLAFDGHHEGGK